MELVEVGWNGQNDLFFQFQKEETEPHNFLTEEVQNLNIKFELIKINKYDIFKEPPFLVSVKDMYFIEDLLAFSVTLDELKDIENLQINIIKITLFLNSGDRLDIFVDRKYALSELKYQESDLFEYLEEEIIYKRKRKVSIRKSSANVKSRDKKRSKIIDINPSKTLNRNKTQDRRHKRNFDYNIPISESEFEKWLDLKGDKSWETTMYIVREGFEKFKEMESEIKSLNKTIQKIALKSVGSSQPPIYLQSANNSPSINQLNPPPSCGPPKRMDSPTVNSKYNLDDQSSAKVFREKKDPNSMKFQIELMREMKEKFNNVSDVKDLLEKVPEKELTKPRAKTDHLAFLEFKCTEGEKKRKQMAQRLKNLGYEKDTEVLTLEDMESELERIIKKQ